MKFSSAILAVLMLLTVSSFAASKHPPLAGNTPTSNSSPDSSSNPAPSPAPASPIVRRPKKQFVIGAVISSATCGLAIGLSTNPATAAEIGVPILIGGNYLAYRLYQNHPRWSAFVQALSPLGCALGGLGRKPVKPVKTSGNPPSGGNPPPSGGGKPPDPPGGGKPPDPPGGGKPPVDGPCTVHGGTDCGLGNGGWNGGGNTKPPVEPPGDPHTHGNL